MLDTEYKCTYVRTDRRTWGRHIVVNVSSEEKNLVVTSSSIKNKYSLFIVMKKFEVICLFCSVSFNIALCEGH